MEVSKNPYGHVSFGDNDLNPEIPWSNSVEDVPPSTDDSENRATDINNKKEIEMFSSIQGMSSASEEIAKIKLRIKQLEKKVIEMKEVKRMDEPDETQESTSEDEIGIKERVQRCISDMADDFEHRSDEVALRIIDEVYKELSSEDKNLVEDMLRGRLKANELFNYIRDKLSYVIHTPDIDELISNVKLIVWQQSRANDMETKGEDK